MAKKNLWAALVTLDNGDVRRVYRKEKGGYTVVKAYSAGGRFKGIRKPFIKAWAKKKGWTVHFTRKDNPFLIYDSTTGRVKRPLENKLNEVAESVRRYMWIGEGDRTDFQQWEFRMAYLNGWGNLAARCCLKYWPDRVHSWDNCGKQSQSNHKGGDAADAGLFMHGRGNGSTNIGEVPEARKVMHKIGLCLPVPGETWHSEIGNYWAA